MERSGSSSTRRLANGAVMHYGHWAGRCWLPERARPGMRLREQRHRPRGGRPHRRGAATLLRRHLRRADLVRLTSRSGAGPAARCERELEHDRVVPRSARTAPAQRRGRHRLLDRRLPALQHGLTRADLSRWRSPSGNYDPVNWNASGDRGGSAYFTDPSDYVAHLHGDPLDWLGSGCASSSSSVKDRRRPTRPLAAASPAAWAGCWRRRASARVTYRHASAHGLGLVEKQIANDLPRFAERRRRRRRRRFRRRMVEMSLAGERRPVRRSQPAGPVRPA